MPNAFTARDVTQDAVLQALPLLRATWPETDLATWRGFVESFCSDAMALPAITGLFDSSGGLCGVFASHIENGLCEGRFLAIPLFTVVDIGNSLSPVQAMVDAATGKAKEGGCRSFEIRLTSEQSGLLKRLRHLGLHHCASIYSLSSRASGHDMDA